MARTPNAKRILNQALRDDIEDLRCSLAKFRDLTIAFDADMVEAVCIKAPKADKVAEDAMKVDKHMSKMIANFFADLDGYRAKYEAMRGDLELG